VPTAPWSTNASEGLGNAGQTFAFTQTQMEGKEATRVTQGSVTHRSGTWLSTYLILGAVCTTPISADDTTGVKWAVIKSRFLFQTRFILKK
jgi:hypothetical protein